MQIEIEKEMLERVVVALERGADAQVELIRLATEERDYGDSLAPPIMCPHCGAMGPQIRVRNDDRVADMPEFVLIADCQECHNTFFSVPTGWMPFTTPDAAHSFLSERGAA